MLIAFVNFCDARVAVVMAVGASCARNHTVRNVWRAPLWPSFSYFFNLIKFHMFFNAFWLVVSGTTCFVVSGGTCSGRAPPLLVIPDSWTCRVGGHLPSSSWVGRFFCCLFTVRSSPKRFDSTSLCASFGPSPLRSRRAPIHPRWLWRPGSHLLLHVPRLVWLPLGLPPVASRCAWEALRVRTAMGAWAGGSSSRGKPPAGREMSAEE